MELIQINSNIIQQQFCFSLNHWMLNIKNYVGNYDTIEYFWLLFIVVISVMA